MTFAKLPVPLGARLLTVSHVDPTGTFLAIWASFNFDDTVGSEYYPCDDKRGSSNVRGCQTTADNLGIAWRQQNDVEGAPLSANQDNVPGPVPHDLPLPPPPDPWDLDDMMDTSFTPEEQFVGAPVNPPVKRFSLSSRAGTLESERLSLRNTSFQIRGRGPALVHRGPASSTTNSDKRSNTYSSTIWPTTLTGTLAFPTSGNILTTHDSLLAGLTATNTGSAAPQKTTAAASISCSMQNEVRLQIMPRRSEHNRLIVNPGSRQRNHLDVLRLSKQRDSSSFDNPDSDRRRSEL